MPDQKAPLAAAPGLSVALIAGRDAALKAFNHPVARLTRKISRKLSRRFGVS